jgi:hypothetical protein
MRIFEVSNESVSDSGKFVLWSDVAPVLQEAFTMGLLSRACFDDSAEDEAIIASDEYREFMDEALAKITE